MNITVPGAVWEEALDPDVTGMQSALGLSDPRVIKRGRGWTAAYDDVPEEEARELAIYLSDRAETMLRQSIEDAGVFYTMRRTAERILGAISGGVTA